MRDSTKFHPAEDSAADIWERCLNIIKRTVSDTSYSLWFDPAAPIKYENNVIEVKVPSAIHSEILDRQFYARFKSLLDAEIGPGSDIRLKIHVDKPELGATLESYKSNKTILSTDTILETNPNPNTSDDPLMSMPWLPETMRPETDLDRQVPEDPLKYIEWLRERRRQLGLRRATSLDRGYEEDCTLVLGHLGYRGRFDRHFRQLWTDPLFLANVQVKPGIIVSLHGTLQRHGELEYPNLERDVFDADEMFCAGEIIWIDNGQASAVVKDVSSGIHAKVEEVYGVSTRGFLLLTPPGLTEPVWTWPREPVEAGGRDRPFYYKTGRTENDVRGIVVESFTLPAGVLEFYRDLSGITVPVLPVERTSLSHRDHLARESRLSGPTQV